MSLPSFKFTNLGAPTNNESANSGLSSLSKMTKSGIMFDKKSNIMFDKKSNILSSIKEKAQDTFKDVEMPSLDISDSSGDADDSDGGSFFSIGTLIKLILIGIIVWFMWSSLSTNGDFHLGMVEFGDKVTSFFKSMEDKGRWLVGRMTNTPITAGQRPDSDSDSDSDDADTDTNADADADADTNANANVGRHPIVPHRAPVPPAMTNSSDKKPGFVGDDNKYTFLDKADRSYTGTAPRADDSTSVTQKHQTGKGGYCYIGEDRGFRSCVKVEASDKCMSGEVFSRHDICVNPTLRE